MKCGENQNVSSEYRPRHPDIHPDRQTDRQTKEIPGPLLMNRLESRMRAARLAD